MHAFPTHLLLPDSLKTDGMVLCDQMKCLDINEREYRFIESVSKDYLEEVLELIHKLF
ncbi:MAG: type II toxin-antitoxin system PemK/MazF family toxin [Lachnospiraceae bacterium]|nr:type II toxin-antitoxin system PemK/MazF family toxin [Lachnospiraceae bacterium]